MKATLGARWWSAIAAALVFSVGPWMSAEQARPGQAPAFRSGTEVVSVDVGVVDRQGQPLRDLGAADFVVTVEGQPRKVVSADFVDVASSRPNLAVKPAPSFVSTNEGIGVGRQFVFIVDQNTLEPGSTQRVAAAASRFFAQLTFADRSALMLVPVGTNLQFTWAHDQVRAALQRVTGLSSPVTSWEMGSLSEARDISNSNMLALRTVGDRECRGSGGISAGNAVPPIQGTPTATPAPAPSAPPSGGGQTGGTGTGSPSGGGGGSSGGGSGSSTSRSSSSSSLFGLDACRRDIQMQAESTWRTAQMISMSSLTSLREALSTLARVPGDKIVVLISGGWPLDDREVTSLMSTVAADAVAARATLHTIFVPSTSFSASRRTISVTPSQDHYLQVWPLETLSSMTGGASYRAEVGAESAFERLGRELSGFYRIGVEKLPMDGDGKTRRMKVQVPRGSVTVRARAIFDAPNYEDRDWAARISGALESPVPSTGLGLRVTNYLASASETDGRINVVLAGEASRLQPGEASFQVVVRDLTGKKILTGEKPLGDATADALPFSANIPLAPGSYIIRIAVMDSAGRVGSIDHRVDARPTPIGALSVAGPLLVRVPPGEAAEPRFALDGVRQDERLALEVDLEGESAGLAGANVTFEIATTADGPALFHRTSGLTPGPRAGAMLAQVAAEMRLLPPGSYVARAKIASDGGPLGEVQRTFEVLAAPRPSSNANGGTVVTAARPTLAAAAVRPPLSTVPPFALKQALTPAILGGFLDRVAARPDAASAAVRDVLARARNGDIENVVVSDALAAETPVAAFVKGLALLAQNKLNPAADQFRNAIRAAADFYPAMVYLGVCHAAGGNDKEAAGAWRTALIKEGDVLPLHVLLTDALLRQGRVDLALQTVESAQARWPDDEGLKRRFIVASLLGGKPEAGFQAVDVALEKRSLDEPSLALSVHVLYERFVSDRPVESVEQDRARMVRYVEAYRAQDGPSLALIETWLAAVQKKQ
jgi:VWFA-related protein